MNISGGRSTDQNFWFFAFFFWLFLPTRVEWRLRLCLGVTYVGGSFFGVGRERFTLCFLNWPFFFSLLHCVFEHHHRLMELTHRCLLMFLETFDELLCRPLWWLAVFRFGHCVHHPSKRLRPRCISVCNSLVYFARLIWGRFV